MKPEIDIYADEKDPSLEHKIAVMQAYANNPSLTVQRYSPITGWINLIEGLEPSWCWAEFRYRIHPKHKPVVMVPLTMEDIPPVCWVRWIGRLNAVACLVVELNENYVFLSSSCKGHAYEDLADKAEYSTDLKAWKPMNKTC